MRCNEEQLIALKKYYPISDYSSLGIFFPGFTKKEIISLANTYGIRNNNPGHRLDLKGQVFGRLTVIEIDHVSSNHKVYWKCICSCGNERVVDTSSLRQANTKSCGCLNTETISTRSAVDHTGKKFGMLTAIERLPKYHGGKRTYYRCVCECGNEKIVAGSGLICGKTKTCGCLSRTPLDFKEKFSTEKDNTSKCFLIYKHTAPNGKVYIGITRQDAERRWQNGNGYNTQKRFWKAIQKYGWNNFSHEILEENLTEKEACEREVILIKQYKSIDSKYGYNTSEGGGTGRSLVTPIMQYFQNKPVNFFVSQRQAAELLGVSDSTIQNYIKNQSLIKGYRFEAMPMIHTYDIDESLYNIRSEEHLGVAKLIRDQCRQKTISRNQSRVREVCQYDMDGHFIKSFSSITEAQKSILGAGDIVAALKGYGNSKSAGGYQWRYYDGNNNDISPLHVNGRPVLQINPISYNLIAKYFSMAEAERATGISRTQIIKSCQRTHITSGGFIWRYENDPNAFVPVILKKEQNRFRIPINQYSLDGQYLKSYKSITEAEKNNPTINGIRAAVSDKAINKSAGGFMWMVDNGNHCNIKPYHVNGRYIEQIDAHSGEVIKIYPSIRSAQQETGINNIAAVCSGKRKVAGGFFWQYCEEKQKKGLN